MMHSHRSFETCTPECRAYDPKGWRCSKCHRQRPMMADTEDWPEPICDECFLQAPEHHKESGGVHPSARPTPPGDKP